MRWNLMRGWKKPMRKSMDNRTGSSQRKSQKLRCRRMRTLGHM